MMSQCGVRFGPKAGAGKMTVFGQKQTSEPAGGIYSASAQYVGGKSER